MNIQLVKIVHIMIMLKRVRRQLRENHRNGEETSTFLTGLTLIP